MRTVFLLLLTACLLGCGEKSKHTPNPAPPDSVVLYAIDGGAIEEWEAEAREQMSPDQIFRGYPILGQVDLTGTEEGQQLADTMQFQHLEPNDDDVPDCWNPRHGLTVVRGDTTTHYVICFQCSKYHWRIEPAGDGGNHTLSSGDPNAFTAPLTAAGIELAE